MKSLLFVFVAFSFRIGIKFDVICRKREENRSGRHLVLSSRTTSSTRWSVKLRGKIISCLPSFRLPFHFLFVLFFSFVIFLLILGLCFRLRKNCEEQPGRLIRNRRVDPSLCCGALMGTLSKSGSMRDELFLNDL